MPTTADELVVARSWIGENESEDVFNERFDRWYVQIAGTVTDDTKRRAEAMNRAIEESLRSQLAVMTLDQPSSASADGNSYSNVQNLVALQKNLETFMAQYGSQQADVKRQRRLIGR